jgi:hypothetical protein
MKKHTSNILIVLFLSLMVVGCFQNFGIIKGKITDKDNKSMSKIKVMVKPGDYEATTDENGEYRIEEIPFGNYTVTATSGSFSNSEEVSVQDESFVSCESINVNSKVEIEVNIKINIGTPGSSTFTLTTNVNPSVAGTINLNPTGGTYEEGTEVTLTAISNSGYMFSNWSGGVSGSSNPTVVTVSTNTTVTANFSTEAGLVAHDKFDENSGDTINDSAGTNHGTRYGASWTTGISGSALDFDGVDNYIELSNESSFDFNWNTPVTFAFWAMLNGDGFVITKQLLPGGNDAHSGWYITFEYRDPGELNINYHNYHDPVAQIGIIAYGDADLSTAEYENNWHFYAITYDGSGSYTGVSFYVDGIKDTTKVIGGEETNTDSILSNNPVLIGKRDLTPYEGWWSGSLDEVMIYNKVLTDTEILQEYNLYYEPPTFTLTTNVNPSGAGTINLDPAGGTYEEGTDVTLTAVAGNGYIFSNWSGGASGTSNPTVVTVNANITVTANFSVEPGLVAYYNFDENSGDTINDSAGTNNGTRYGASWTTGKSGSALDFDGVDNYIELSNESSFDFDWNTPVTFAFWAMLNGDGFVITKQLLPGPNDAHSGWYITFEYRDPGELNINYHNVYYHSTIGGRIIAYGDADLSTTEYENNWHFYAITYDGSGSWTGVNFYIDGVKDTSKVISGGYETNTDSILSDNPVFIGKRDLSPYEDWWSGSLDEVMIYDKVLTDTEILQQYNSY